MAVLEHFTWGGKEGGKRSCQGGMGGADRTVYNLFIVKSRPNTSVLNAQEKQGVQTKKLKYSIKQQKVLMIPF